MVAEQRHDLLGLAGAQQAVIDEDAGELVADRLVDQHRGDRRIDAAGEAADHPALADLGADLARSPPRGRPPWSSRRCSPRCCARSCGSAARRAACARPPGGTARRRSCALSSATTAKGAFSEIASDLEAVRQPGDPVAVAHPDRIVLARLARRPRRAGCRPVISTSARPNSRVVPALDLAAELRRHGLLAVADAEDRHAGLEQLLRRARRGLVVTDAGPPERITPFGFISREGLGRLRGRARSRNRRPPRARAAR